MTVKELQEAVNKGEPIALDQASVLMCLHKAVFKEGLNTPDKRRDAENLVSLLIEKVVKLKL